MFFCFKSLLWGFIILIIPYSIVCIESLPYDSSLVLGQLIDEARLATLIDLGKKQTGVNAAFDAYNANLQLKLSLQMSLRELVELGVNVPDSLQKQMDDIDKTIGDSLVDYVTKKIAYDTSVVANAQSQTTTPTTEPTSPIDFSKSKLTNMPISSDSFNIDVQYFRVESTQQGSETHATKIASYVAGQLSIGKGFSISSDVKDNTQKQVNQQFQNHNILGTLVIVAKATHKSAALFSPLVYDLGNLQSAWNTLSGEGVDLPANQGKWAQQMMGKTQGSTKEITLLTGVTYGSSFVGFIHYTQDETTQNSQETEASHLAAEAAAKVAYWEISFAGGAGFSDDQSSDIKNLLSTAQISTHMSCMTMGLIPSIKSQTINQALKAFTTFSPDDTMKQMGILMDDTAGSVPKGAEAIGNARRGGTLTELENKKTQSVLSAIGEVDKSQNQVIDMNSMMIALDDYVQITRGATSGVPVNFYTTKIGQNDVIEEWFNQNNPGFMDCIKQGGEDCWDKSTGKQENEKKPA